MYNRYIPNGTAYTRVLEEDEPPRPLRPEPEPAAAAPSAPEPELDVDMGQLRRMMSALRGGGHDSANRHLLEAMKPYLAEKRRRKIDRAMKLARLASLAELAAEDLEGDDHV